MEFGAEILSGNLLSREGKKKKGINKNKKHIEKFNAPKEANQSFWLIFIQKEALSTGLWTEKQVLAGWATPVLEDITAWGFLDCPDES